VNILKEFVLRHLIILNFNFILNFLCVPASYMVELLDRNSRSLPMDLQDCSLVLGSWILIFEIWIVQLAKMR